MSIFNLKPPKQLQPIGKRTRDLEGELGQVLVRVWLQFWFWFSQLGQVRVGIEFELEIGLSSSLRRKKGGQEERPRGQKLEHTLGLARPRDFQSEQS